MDVFLYVVNIDHSQYSAHNGRPVKSLSFGAELWHLGQSRKRFHLRFICCFGAWIQQGLTSEERKSILHAVADALLANEAKIKVENDADVELARKSGISNALIGRLTIKPGKVRFC